MKRQKSFAETLAEVKAMPPRARDVRPGEYNADGDLFDPAGTLLTRAKASITTADARALVADGALLAAEGCGCGGSSGCEIDWIADDDRAKLRDTSGPVLAGRRRTPTWIDLWEGAGSVVVFAHGDVRWGGMLG
ncbi:hypothetical protein IC607_13450 [Cellulomonas sp. JH27-2]|uniref:hypothetical protein n=1 Tax=Cellulomonas sp. JH27-2 TaxID=2774139 RepID=UPI001783C208|nr:hypothetical protein [Cellulomonas sp. JH27-2]MBD8059974.1 hypothetical protein [Cellulomonas sp. JH27-2]